jgi:hypothetical protein
MHDKRRPDAQGRHDPGQTAPGQAVAQDHEKIRPRRHRHGHTHRENLQKTTVHA